jgi:molybdate transport system substrate-binding protein
MNILNILSGGAAQGLVKATSQTLEAETGFKIRGEFGAVGVMADKLRTGTPTDMIILTSALVTTLADEGRVFRASIRDVGTVETALAVRSDDALVMVRDAASLREAFLASDAIFVPDTESSTAGRHVAKMLDGLGIATATAKRLKIFPNGAAAMRHLAESDARQPIGCTQATEIISTKGVKLSGGLPAECGLKTMYTAAITASAAAPQQASHLIDLLTSDKTSVIRSRAGFSNGSS